MFNEKLLKFFRKTTEYFHLLFKSAHQNYYRIEACRKDTDGTLHCEVTFDSYTALKRFQNKLRKVSFGFSTVLALVVIVSLVTNLITGPIQQSFAATYYFNQTAWDAMPDENATAIHEGGVWTKYASSTDGLVTGETIQIATSSFAWTQTTDTDFNTGDMDTGKVVVSGSGTDGMIELGVAAALGTTTVQTDEGTGESGFNKAESDLYTNAVEVSGAGDAAYVQIKEPVVWTGSFDSGSDGANCITLNNGGSIEDEGGINVRKFRFTSFIIQNGITCNLTGAYPVSIVVRDAVTIAGTLNASASGATGYAGGKSGVGEANGNGYFTGYGLVGGTVNYKSGGGGAYGGNGGTSTDGVGGTNYGDSTISILYGGSAGGGGGLFSGTGVAGGGSGGAIYIKSATSISITGSITANGGTVNGTGSSGGGGGGAGGSIKLEAPIIDGSGSIASNGGVGGTHGSATISYCYGGGGGGGRVYLARNSGSFNTNNISVSGGTSARINASCLAANLYGVDGSKPSPGTFVNFLEYTNSANYSSYVDSGQVAGVAWKNFIWTKNETGNTTDASITFKVKTSATNSMPADIDTAGCSTTAVSGTVNGERIFDLSSCGAAVNPAHRYLWYKATLTSSADHSKTPKLDDVKATWNNTYQATGTYTSPIYDTAGNNSFGALTYTKDTTPVGSSVSFKVRSSNSATMDGASAWGDCSAITSSGTDISGDCVNDGDRYVQYQAVMAAATDRLSSPTVSDVTINYTRYATTTQTLISSKYNSSSDANVIGGVVWKDNVAMQVNSSFDVYLRTASTSDLLDSAGWQWIASTSASTLSADCARDGVTVTCSSSAIPDEMNGTVEGINNRWFQYKLEFSSDGTGSPVINEFTVKYVVNAAPEFGANPVTAEQNADGTVTIHYEARDIDTTEGSNTPGEVLPSFEYSLNGGATWSAITSGLSANATSSLAVDTENYASSTVIWMPKTILDGVATTTTQVRVIIDDGEAANNNASQATENFVLDLKNPVADNSNDSYESIKVDARQAGATANEVQITLKAADDSNIYYRYSLSATPETPDGINANSGQWILDNAGDVKTDGLSINILLNAAAMVNTKKQKIYIQYKDAFENINTTVYDAETPERPTAMMIQDITNAFADPKEVGLFLTWKTSLLPIGIGKGDFASYVVQRAENTDWTGVTDVKTITDRAENYFRDKDIVADQNYYYRVYVIDGVGNKSYYSATEAGDNVVLWGIPNGVADGTEGGGGVAIATPPVIDMVTVANAYSNQARITWNTNELSNSIVEFMTNNDGNFESATITGVATMVDNIDNYGIHSVTIIGLEPDTTYYYQVKSTNANGITATEKDGETGAQFTTLAGSKITPNTVNINDLNNSGVTIKWETDQNANSYVGYSTDPLMADPAPIEVGQSDSTTDHSVVLSGLNQATRYYYYVKSGDARDDNEGLYHYFQTLSDNEPPTISNIRILAKKSIAVITWETNELATTTFEYGETDAYGEIRTDTTASIQHSLELTGLSASTTYHYKITAADLSNNSDVTLDAIFTTEGVKISDVDLVNIAEQAVAVDWKTDDATEGRVRYAKDYALSDSLIETDFGATQSNHHTELNGLDQKTKYYYQVVSKFGSREFFSPVYYFTSGDNQAPTITGVTEIGISATAATITWQTNESADSFAEYGEVSGDYTETASSSILTTTHNLTLNNLKTDTVYHFRLISADANSNATTSAEYSFQTHSFAIGDVFASSATTSATITWTTDAAASSQVEYTTRANFSDTALFPSSSSDSVLDHIVVLDNLNSATVYYYKVRSIKDGRVKTSPIYTFSTGDQVAPIIVRQPLVSTKTDTTATIFWETNELSDSQVYFDADNDGGYALSEEDSTLTTLHFVKLENLLASTTYYYTVESRDGNSNAATTTQYNFITLGTQVAHDDLTNPGNPRFVMITDTEMVVALPTANSSATSMLCYATSTNININTCSAETIVSPTKTHSYHLTNLSPETTYYVRTKITDSQNGEINFISEEVSTSTLSTRYSEEYVEDLMGAGTYTEAEMQVKIAEINQKNTELSARDAEISQLQAQLQAAQSGSGGGMMIVDKTDKVAPKISDIKIDEVADTYAKISWLTDEDSTSMIFYGESTDYLFSEVDIKSITEKIKKHTIIAKKLEAETKYHFAVASTDAWGNLGVSKDLTFQTLEEGATPETDLDAGKGSKKENTLEKITEMISELLATGKVDADAIREAVKKTAEPPMIAGEGPEVSGVTSKAALVNWKTDRKSNSIVSYYVDSMGPDTAQQVGDYSNFVTDHSVMLPNLSPGRKYIFTVQSVDALGNIGVSKKGNFETEGVPFVSKVSISNITNSSVEISWYSNIESSSELEYGYTEQYGKSASFGKDLTLTHNIRLHNLSAGDTYHFRVKGLSKKEETITSDDYTFTTLSSLDITTYSVDNISNNTAKISWKTNNNSTSEIEYVNSENKKSNSVTENKLTKEHIMELKDLTPGVKYIFKIKGEDENKQKISSEELSFTTLIDTSAPIIEYVQADMALISKGDQSRVQAVVTWKTNEVSSSELIFAEGGAKSLPVIDTKKATGTSEVNIENQKYSVVTDAGGLTKKHVLVISDFKSGLVYTFKAKSVDDAGNVAYSKDYTILTPVKEESVLQMIIKTFEDTFGWMKLK